MRQFEACNEAVWEAGRGAFVPALVWVYGEGERVTVAAHPSYDYLADHYRRLMDHARQAGYAEAALWGYWSVQGGNGYQTMRSLAYAVLAEDLAGAVARALKNYIGEAQP